MSKRIISAKRNNVIAKRLSNQEEEKKIITLDNAPSLYNFGKCIVTHVGPKVEDVKVGEIVFIAPGLAQPLNPIKGNPYSEMMIIFSENAISYSVTE